MQGITVLCISDYYSMKERKEKAYAYYKPRSRHLCRHSGLHISWSQHVDVHQYLEEFLSACYANLKQVFDGAYIKTLGDGAMVIQECPVPQSPGEVAALLETLLLKICHVETHFRATCDIFSWQRGHKTELRLGWGVTRGIVLALSREDLAFSDFVGPNINLAARLCYLARPAGIMVNRDDFPLLPHLPDDPWGASCTVLERTFLPEEHHVNGVHDAIAVWSLLTIHECTSIDSLVAVPRAPL